MQGNRTHAAKILGISIRGLRIKLLSYAQAGVAVPPVAEPGPEERIGGFSPGKPALGSLALDG